MASNSKKKTFNNDTLNLILATCAILISLASFYATYLQADAAERQVKAQTWPWLEFIHGNYDAKSKKHTLSFSITNSGVGPALIKKVTFKYKDKKFDNLYSLLDSCCFDTKELHKKAEQYLDINPDEPFALITSPTKDRILSPGSNLQILVFPKVSWNQAEWERLDKARWKKLGLDICYCSLFEQCYETNERKEIKEVKSCKM